MDVDSLARTKNQGKWGSACSTCASAKVGSITVHIPRALQTHHSIANTSHRPNVFVVMKPLMHLVTGKCFPTSSPIDLRVLHVPTQNFNTYRCKRLAKECTTQVHQPRKKRITKPS